jgi:hypothetical protein
MFFGSAKLARGLLYIGCKSVVCFNLDWIGVQRMDIKAKIAEAQSAQQFALKMLGEKMVQYATTNNRDDLDNMTFWHNQAWMIAKELAELNSY